ncbi:glycosyltransferase [Streptococcus mitis]|uniref:glycosyltransferase n=1 Tax=Streptococcus mitis TaxID=28037 RepID=UPI0021B7B8BA|nr:glycosyltransferase [Streptococcus mitis]
MLQDKKSVVFAGDYAYIRQIETAMKSLCRHNSHVKIYVLNQDIPQEWFSELRMYVQEIGGDLIDCKLIGQQFQMNWSNKLPHINHMTFARYFIPDFVKEDKVLYLDSDLVVTGDLTPLFEFDLGENYLAAARSCFGVGVGFNAGVLLINNKKWKSENIRQQLIELTEREHENVNEGDQSILNMLFKDQVSFLEDKYNFQIGFDYGAAAFKHQFIFDIPLDPLPVILHYISQDKPWNQFSVGRLREIWWEYSLMDWSFILNEWFSKGVKYPSKSPIFKLQCVNLTNSWCVEKIDYLAEQLPDVHFHIVAYTNMANELLALTRFPNVTVYPNSLPMLLEQIVINSDLYLDLNHDRKLEDAYEFVAKHKKPMLAFENTYWHELSENAYAGIYSTKKPEDLVEAIKFYMRERKI